MKVGLTYTEKQEMENFLHQQGVVSITDDMLEEYDRQETIEAIVDSLHQLGHDVIDLGWGYHLIDYVLNESRVTPLDFVFNISEGVGGRSRESQVPALLDMFGIPYVGSDPLALGASLDKWMTRTLAAAAGVAVPKGFVEGSPELAVEKRYMLDLDYPLIVKPLHEGSSRGVRRVSVVEDDYRLKDMLVRVRDEYRQPALVEEFIEGPEVTVGVAGDPPEVIGVMEIAPKPEQTWKVYGLEVKRDYLRVVDYFVPPRFNGDVLEDTTQAALRVFHALGCRDVARIDFRLTVAGRPYLLDVNPLPGLDPVNSDLVIMAKQLGLSHADLVGKIIAGAVSRAGVRRRR
jgi:D-alanine-D-alanine ligase